MKLKTTTYVGRSTGHRGLAGIVVILVVGYLAGACATTPRVVLDNQIALVRDQPFEGSHRTMDYQLQFVYTFRQGAGEASDHIEFTGRLVPRRGLDTFILRLHFLDAAGAILATGIVYAPGAGRGAGRATIERQFEVPADAVAMGFSHVAQERRIMRRRR